MEKITYRMNEVVEKNKNKQHDEQNKRGGRGED